MSIFYYALAFIAALGPLIIFHELGHYWVARLFGVRVLRFSVGFGRPLLRFQPTPKSTEWVIAPIPLGGYVALLGEQDVEPGQYTAEELEHAFNRQSVYKRAAIMVAGPFANFLMAVLLYAAIGMHGVEEPRALLGPVPANSSAAIAGFQGGDEVIGINGSAVHSSRDLRWQLLRIAVDHGAAHLSVARAGATSEHTLDLSSFKESDLEGDYLAQAGFILDDPAPVIESIEPDSVAARAGLLQGDELVAVGGVRTPLRDQFVRQVRGAAGKEIELELVRDGNPVRVTLVPQSRHDEQTGEEVGRIGVGLRLVPMKTVIYGPLAAIGNAIGQTWETSRFTLQMLGKMIAGQLSVKNLSGPVTIAEYAGHAAQHGLIFFMLLVAYISTTIGLMNLLPIPMLDGGHLLYHLVEILTGRPPSERFLQFSQGIGMVVLAGLMGLALFNDFSRLLS